MDAEIAFTQGAQNGICQRMRESVSVGMSGCSTIRFNADATQNQRPSCNQPVRIIADAYSEHKKSVVSC